MRPFCPAGRWVNSSCLEMQYGRQRPGSSWPRWPQVRCWLNIEKIPGNICQLITSANACAITHEIYLEINICNMTVSFGFPGNCQLNDTLLDNSRLEHLLLVGMQQPAYFIMMVADVPVPNKHQAISNHHVNSTVTQMLHESYYVWNISHWSH